MAGRTGLRGVAHGPDIAPDQPAAERGSYGEVVLHGRLRAALARLNPDLPPAALDDAFRRLTRLDRPSLEANNHALHRLIVDGVNVEYTKAEGRIAGAQARVLDYDDPDNNDWLAVNQFTVVEKGSHGGRSQHPPARHRPVRQRPAAGDHRAEERRRREGRHLESLQATPDLQGRDPVAAGL
jgi:type I restriction enzyme, R subunit